MEILDERVPQRPGRTNPRAVKRKINNYPTKSRTGPYNPKQQKPTIVIIK